MNQLFPKVKEAVNAMALCCGEHGTPIAQSEIYNETWLLRMVLSCLHDYAGDFKMIRDKAALILMRMCAAVRIRWISEGGLRPTLEKEGTTWTDAILGDVDLNNEMDNESDSGGKRGVEIKRGCQDVGIIVVEAKVGSKLAAGTINYEGYNQSARNIACLAQLVMNEPEDFVRKCAFVVLGPRNAIKSWKGQVENQRIVDVAMGIIERQHAVAPKRYNDEKKFLATAKMIAEQSTVISWDEIVQTLGDSELSLFYASVLKENGVSDL